MSLEDELRQRYAHLGMDRANILKAIQSSLDALYPSQTRVVSLDDEILRVVTPNASVASELRLHQIELLGTFAGLTTSEYPIARIVIQVRTLH